MSSTVSVRHSDCSRGGITFGMRPVNSTSTFAVCLRRALRAHGRTTVGSSLPIATFTHKGGGNFVVMQSDGTWPDLLINEIGTYNGTVPLSSGPSLLLITADGKWTMTEE